MTAAATSGGSGFRGVQARLQGLPEVLPVHLLPTRRQETVGGDRGGQHWLARVAAEFRQHRLAVVSLWTLVTIVATCFLLPAALPWSATDVDTSVLSA